MGEAGGGRREAEGERALAGRLPSTAYRLPSQAGFTLVGVAVLIAILVVLVAAVGPSVAAVMQRDKENELIFRGKQYARAIVAFQKRYGRPPMELKELSEKKPRSIRQMWREPMCNCDDWQVIIAGTPEAIPMSQNLPGPTGSGLGPPPGSRRTPGFGNQPPTTYGGMFPPTTPAPDQFGSGGAPPRATPVPSIFGQTGKTVGPIVGVRSKVHKQAFKKWRDKEFTDEWRFIAGDADNDLQRPFDPGSLNYKTPTPTR
jgi:type II secretory pathway pseudopilin PulG